MEIAIRLYMNMNIRAPTHKDKHHICYFPQAIINTCKLKQYFCFYSVYVDEFLVIYSYIISVIDPNVEYNLTANTYVSKYFLLNLVGILDIS